MLYLPTRRIDMNEDMCLCYSCDGSGEGMYDGARCRTCDGTGSLLDSDEEFDRYEDEVEKDRFKEDI
jgi:DnaJ-class molecular chaperone